MINYIVESFAVVIVNLQQEIRKQADTQIVDAKQLEVKVNPSKNIQALSPTADGTLQAVLQCWGAEVY